MGFQQRCRGHQTIMTTTLLSLMTMTVIGIDNRVASSPMVESPSSSSSPVPFTSTSDELDSDTSRKVLGSSVVTSVSVVMNSSDGKSNTSTTPVSEPAPAMQAIAVTSVSATSLNATSTTADNTTQPIKSWSQDVMHDLDGSRMDSAELKNNLIASPGNFLNPDKYEFYTFDEAGDLVKRLMTWDEIQGLIAAGDTDGLLSEAVVPMYYNENVLNSNSNSNAATAADKLHDTHLTANEFQSSDMQDVHKVVESVQNVLKSELAAVSSQSKIIPLASATAVKPSLAHSPNWSSLFLPNFLENLDEDAFVDLQQHQQHHLLSDDSGTSVSAGSSTTLSPIVQHTKPFENFNNHSVLNETNSPSILSTQMTMTSKIFTTATTLTNSDSTSEKVPAVALTNHSAITSPAIVQQKFTVMKNTSKPQYHKYTPYSSTSDRNWPPLNALVTNEKPPTKHFFRPTTVITTSLSPTMWPLSSSAATSWPMKSYSTTGIPKTVTTASENSMVPQYTTGKMTTTHDSFTVALTNLLNQMSSDQQSAKIRPNVEAFVRDSSPTTAPTVIETTANNHPTSYYSQHNTSVINSNSIQFVDRQKNNTSHHQPWLSSSPPSSLSFKNSITHNEKTSVWQSATEATPFSQYTPRTSNTSHNHSHHQPTGDGGSATTKTVATSQQQQYSSHTNANNVNYTIQSTLTSLSASPFTNLAQSSPSLTPSWYKQSASHSPSGTDSYFNHQSNIVSWKHNRTTTNKGIAASISTTPSLTTVGKFGHFTSYRTATTSALTTPSTNDVIFSTPLSSSKQYQQSQSYTTSAEPLVTWTSTYGLDDQQMNNELSHSGQILDSDKLVTEQYVSGSTATTTTPSTPKNKAPPSSFTHSQLTHTEGRPSTQDEAYFGTKKTTIWSTISEDKTNVYINAKKPTTHTTATQPTISTKSPQSPAPSSFHTWLSVTTTPTATGFTHNGSSNSESKTTITNPNNLNYHHQHLQTANYNQNSTSTGSFSSYYHRERPSESGSTPSADSTLFKYTKNPPTINTTTFNEMVMQRIPTLNPPNKISFATNSGIDSTFHPSSVTNHENELSPSSWLTKSTSSQHHSSTESVKNLTQIAVMVNKPNDTQITNKYSFTNTKYSETKRRPTGNSNSTPVTTMMLLNHPFSTSSATLGALNNENNPSIKLMSNIKNNIDEDKTQQIVKPINLEPHNNCSTSSISNSVSNVGGGDEGGDINNHETWQSLSYNSNISNAVSANTSQNNHFPPLHQHHNDNSDHNNDMGAGAASDNHYNKYNYHTTVTNYANIFSRNQNTSTNKYNSGSSTSSGVLAAAQPTVATWDAVQQKVTLPSNLLGEKSKENSHIYYYKLPPANLQSSKTNANTLPTHSLPLAHSANSLPTTTSSEAIGHTTNLNDRTYQKVTTVARPSLPSSSLYLANELPDSSHNDWKQNSASTAAASWTAFKTWSNTAARIASSSSASTAVDNDNPENREVSATAFDQMLDTKSSSFNESTMSIKHDDGDMNNNYNGNIYSTSSSSDNGDTNSTKMKTTIDAWSMNSNTTTTKPTELVATPQIVTVFLNFSTSSNVSSTTSSMLDAQSPNPIDVFSDFRKEYVSQTSDNSTEATANDDDDEDDEDNDSEEGAEDENNGDDGDIDENEKKDQITHSETSEQSGSHTSINKNQIDANTTMSTQYASFQRKTSTTPLKTTSTTTINESSPFNDRTRNNVNKLFTTPNQQRLTTPWPSMQSQKKPMFNVHPNNNSVVSNISFTSDTSSSSATTMKTIVATTRAGPSTITTDNDVHFVRVKLENRTATSSGGDIASISTATINKHKDEKIKTTLSKNQSPKPGTVSWAAPTSTTTPAASLNTSTNTASTPTSNPGPTLRSPAAVSTLIHSPQSLTLLSSTVTPTTTNSVNGNNNPTSTAVELHPAPHENMGLEASVAYLGDDVRTFIDLCNELSFKIWTTQTGKSLTTSRSIVLSPFALLSTLAMIFLGARGSSSGIMNDFLRLDDMVTFNPHQVFRNITESAISMKNTGAANVAFVREVFSDKTKGNVLEFYKERLQQYYDTYVEEINFNVIGDLVRKRTNLLVKRQTQGRLQDYMRGTSITMKPPLATFTANIFQTDCSAASTEGRDGEMYFVVRPSTRQRRLVPIPAVVYRGGGFLAGYEPGLDATAVTLSPESIISTILVLPGQQGQVAPGDGLARLEQRLLESSYRRGAWSRLLRSLLFRHGLEVQIPRFSHKSIVNLTAGLQKMGMGEIFSPDKADLRGINGLLNELHLSDCVQANTFSTCGEESVGARHHVETFPSFGQRAGAARFQNPAAINKQLDDDVNSESSSRWSASPPLPSLSSRPRQARLPENPRLRFDRPFLYIVRHNPTGMILYIGRFNPRLLP